jgi:ferredoxin
MEVIMAKVKLDQSICIGCGSCVASCGVAQGGNFDFGEDNLPKVVNEEPTEKTQEAVDACPVGAISIEE